VQRVKESVDETVKKEAGRSLGKEDVTASLCEKLP
jgi:hypothetical protein